MIETLEEALKYDSLVEAEKLTGVSYKESDVTSAVGLSLMHEQRKKTNALLFLNRDTNSWDQTPEEFLAVVKDLGFEEVYREQINERTFNGKTEPVDDQFMIFWRDGVLLTVDTYTSGKKSINGAKAYFNYRGPRGAMFHCSSCPIWINGEFVNVYDGNCDVREGLRLVLDKMSEAGEILPRWIARPFLWLLSYEDERKRPSPDVWTPQKENRWYHVINEEKIAKLPEHVRRAITPA